MAVLSFFCSTAQSHCYFFYSCQWRHYSFTNDINIVLLYLTASQGGTHFTFLYCVYIIIYQFLHIIYPRCTISTKRSRWWTSHQHGSVWALVVSVCHLCLQGYSCLLSKHLGFLGADFPLFQKCEPVVLMFPLQRFWALNMCSTLTPTIFSAECHFSLAYDLFACYFVNSVSNIFC